MKPNLEVPKVLKREITSLSDFPEYFHHHYSTHLFCHEGTMRFVMNHQPYVISQGEFLFWFAQSHLTDFEIDEPFKATVLFVENSFLMNNVPDQRWSINAFLYTRKHPVKHLRNDAPRQRILNNFNRLYSVFQEDKHEFYEEMLKLQMRIFILEMWHVFSEEYNRHQSTLLAGTTYDQFIQLLSEHCLQQREVQFYASKLAITPKHLSHICKTTSGLTASEWIVNYVRERLELMLESPEWSVSQIADEMEFSSRSFFTRYVKKVLGVTPSEYRKRLG